MTIILSIIVIPLILLTGCFYGFRCFINISSADFVSPKHSIDVLRFSIIMLITQLHILVLVDHLASLDGLLLLITLIFTMLYLALLVLPIIFLVNFILFMLSQLFFSLAFFILFTELALSQKLLIYFYSMSNLALSVGVTLTLFVACFIFYSNSVSSDAQYWSWSIQSKLTFLVNFTSPMIYISCGLIGVGAEMIIPYFSDSAEFIYDPDTIPAETVKVNESNIQPPNKIIEITEKVIKPTAITDSNLLDGGKSINLAYADPGSKACASAFITAVTSGTILVCAGKIGLSFLFALGLPISVPLGLATLSGISIYTIVSVNGASPETVVTHGVCWGLATLLPLHVESKAAVENNNGQIPPSNPGAINISQPVQDHRAHAEQHAPDIRVIAQREVQTQTDVDEVVRVWLERAEATRIALARVEANRILLQEAQAEAAEASRIILEQARARVNEAGAIRSAEIALEGVEAERAGAQLAKIARNAHQRPNAESLSKLSGLQSLGGKVQESKTSDTCLSKAVAAGSSVGGFAAVLSGGSSSASAVSLSGLCSSSSGAASSMQNSGSDISPAAVSLPNQSSSHIQDVGSILPAAPLPPLPVIPSVAGKAAAASAQNLNSGLSDAQNQAICLGFALKFPFKSDIQVFLNISPEFLAQKWDFIVSRNESLSEFYMNLTNFFLEELGELPTLPSTVSFIKNIRSPHTHTYQFIIKCVLRDLITKTKNPVFATQCKLLLATLVTQAEIDHILPFCISIK